MKKSTFYFVLIFFLAAFVWYENKRTFAVEFGVSFNKEYATAIGLDWKKNYLAILDDLGAKYLRLPAEWNMIEKERGRYDFTNLDWQVKEAEKRGAKILLAVGQKIPRWPECHIPDWAGSLSKEEYKKSLLAYEQKVVERYKGSQALEMWQVENEPFIRFDFGNCESFQEEAVLDEINLLRGFDPARKIVITDSGELGTWWKASRVGDIFGTTLYRVVVMPSGRIFTYDWLPPLAYRLKGLLLVKNWPNSIVAELQAEPWAYPGNSTLAEQEKTINLDRLKNNVEYVRHVGVSRAYLWGAEWWYWLKEKHGKSEYWDFVKTVM